MFADTTARDLPDLSGIARPPLLSRSPLPLRSRARQLAVAFWTSAAYRSLHAKERVFQIWGWLFEILGHAPQKGRVVFCKSKARIACITQPATKVAFGVAMIEYDRYIGPQKTTRPF